MLTQLIRQYRKQDLLRDPRKCPTCLRPYEYVADREYWWVDYLMVALGCLVIGAALMRFEFDRNIYHAENVKVTQKFDSYRYKMKFPTGEYVVWFCKNYKPCIPTGAVLTSLRYEDTGECWDIRPMGLGYNLLQDRDGNSIDEHGKIVFDAVKDSCQ